mmetsp:Transcript_19811/g.41356  ORF Transcript_19811/g.41356 Transcript_19811/m.41356 type:complete len:252 (-) Transcript_19811:48-803(-)
MHSEMFTSLRRKAETIERSLESKCNRYIQVAQRISNRLSLVTPSSSSSSNVEEGRGTTNTQDIEDDQAEKSLENDITQLLRQMSSVIDEMEGLIRTSSTTTGSSSQSVLVRRLREIMYDYKSDFRKSNDILLQERSRNELFSRASANVDLPSSVAGDDMEMDSLLRERGAINSSLLSSRGILGQASEIISDLRNQRTTMSGASSRVKSLAGNVPGINEVIDKIRRKKNKDNAIMGCVIAGCVLFCLWYVFG